MSEFVVNTVYTFTKRSKNKKFKRNCNVIQNFKNKCFHRDKYFNKTGFLKNFLKRKTESEKKSGRGGEEKGSEKLRKIPLKWVDREQGNNQNMQKYLKKRKILKFDLNFSLTKILSSKI